MTQYQWVIEATDIALSRVAANAAMKNLDFDFSRLSRDACEHIVFSGKHAIPELRELSIGAPRRLLVTQDDLAQALRLLNRLSVAPDASSVWQALERFGTPPPWFLIGLCAEASRALNDFDKYAITTKDLKGAGARIRTLALKLAEELANPAVVGALESVRTQYARSGRRVRHYGIDHQRCLRLAELASGVPDVPKVIGQPNSPNARRLFFIKQVTNWVHKFTGTPMRSQVFALASIFFDMADVDPQSLATLAPVRKHKKQTAVC